MPAPAFNPLTEVVSRFVSLVLMVGLPSQDNHFFIGQTANLFRGNSPNDAYVSWMRRWPDAPFIRYLSFANSEVLLVNNLTAHKEVLQTQCYKFVKPNFFERLVGEVVGKGLLFSVGDEHKRQRKLLAGTPHMAALSGS